MMEVGRKDRQCLPAISIEFQMSNSPSADTSADAANAQVAVLRSLGGTKRSELAASWSDQIRDIALQGFRHRSELLDDRHIQFQWLKLRFPELLGTVELTEWEKAKMEDSEPSFLQFIISALDSASISYMVTGSVASSYHGEPRATYDIDIVVVADEKQIALLANELQQRCYVSKPAAIDAVKSNSMFNVIDLTTGTKVDLILRKNRPFSLAEFGRRRAAKLAGSEVFLVSAEDCILSKLEWCKAGESDRQFSDAAKVAEITGRQHLDTAYLKKWATELGVADLLSKILSEP
jgi:hypothetical protein